MKDALSSTSGAHSLGGVVTRLRNVLFTQELLYSTLLLSAVIALSPWRESDLDLLIRVTIAGVVIWVAHVFAGSIVHQGRSDVPASVLASTLGLAKESLGLLLAAVFPVFWLGLGAIGLLDELFAYVLALAGGLVVLFVVAIFAFRDRGYPWLTCIVAGLGAVVVGAIVIVLKIRVH